MACLRAALFFFAAAINRVAPEYLQHRNVIARVLGKSDHLSFGLGPYGIACFTRMPRIEWGLDLAREKRIPC